MNSNGTDEQISGIEIPLICTASVRCTFTQDLEDCFGFHKQYFPLRKTFLLTLRTGYVLLQQGIYVFIALFVVNLEQIKNQPCERYKVSHIVKY